MTAVINATTTGTITASITASTISFTAPDTIADSGSGFGIFSPGDYITISGSTGNDGSYVVATAAAASLTIINLDLGANPLLTEVAGPSITVSAGVGLQITTSNIVSGRTEPIVLVHPSTTDLGAICSADNISNDLLLQAALTGGDVTVDVAGISIPDAATLNTIGSGYPIVPGFIDQNKVIYVSKAGSDSNDGKTPGKAKLTFGAAVTAANATSPSAFDKALVVGLDAGNYFVTSTIAVAASVDIYAPSAELQTLGEYDMMTVVDDTNVTLGRITVQDDDAFDGIRHIGGSNTLTNVYVKTADGLGEGKRFINEAAGHMMVKIGNGKLDGNQGTMFYMQSGAGGKMTVERDYMNIGGGTIGVDALEGASFHMDGGEIEGTTGTAVRIGDLRVTGQMGKIAMTGGTAYDIAPAAVLGLVISEIVSGTRTQTSNNGGLIITAEADRQVYSSQFKLGAYPGFGDMTLNAAPVTGTHTATFQNASGTLAYLSDVQAADEWSEVLSNGNTSGGNNAQMSGTDQLQFGGTVNYIANGATGILEYTSNKGHQLIGPASIFTTGTNSTDIEEVANPGYKFSFDPRMAAGGRINYIEPTKQGILEFNQITATRTWTMPDATGIVALTSDIVSEDLTTTLGIGNSTSGQDIIVTNGDSVQLGSATNTITEGAGNRIAYDSAAGHFMTTGTWAMLIAAANGNLNIGSTTDANKGIQIIPNSGYIQVKNPGNGFPATMAFSNHTAAQTYDFPDATGFVALSNDPSNEVTFAVAAASRVVNHNKARRVTWTCYDAAGNWIQPGSVTDDGNTLTINWAPNQAGSVVYF